MQYRFGLSSAFLFFAVFVVGGCASTPAPNERGSDVRFPKETFLKMMEQGSPDVLCNSEKFRNCLGVSQQRCRKGVIAVAPTCTDEVAKAMPAQLANADEGRRYGKEYGRCVVLKLIASGEYDVNAIMNCK